MSDSIKINRLNGRVAIVTASTEGIGFAIARRLASEGAKVIISSRKEEHVSNAVNKLEREGLHVTGLVCHVAKSEDRKKLFAASERLGGLDILISNAAVNPEVVGVLNTSEKAWDKIFDVNLKAAFLLSKESLPQLRKSKYGRIVFVSSISAYQHFLLPGAYSVSKTALLGLTKATAMQLGPQNITVNCVAPGTIETRFSTILTNTKSGMEWCLSKTLLGRLGKPDDISGVVAFLVSDDGGFVSGETIVASGGMTCHL
ncbi:hypothetical protein WA026_006471 [Henosepilachna vigintioctopunctata]|uniref:Dehydrogenase/reductase SDR family member 4 n=1 Tax=Henosepilachna vigintioctopunctata TaxID=420089 RepID=A0AAW1UEF0_9CUCU